ncbi:hypothetical protein N9586_01700 [Candidatus Pelagibacter sp.]|nr:hypothetical protein [Candidatus Pelagibacter sp.]
MIKKLSFIILLLSITACSTVKEKAGGIKKIGDTCPPIGERSIKDIFCKEAK